MSDPIAKQCSSCGAEHFTEPIGDERPRCGSCGHFVAYADEWQIRLFYKRLEQTALHQDGYVTVGGHVESVHGGVT